LIDLLYETSIGLNDPNVLCIDVVFLDHSNAFDRVSFGLLLENLYTIGIIGQSLAIISSLLYGRNFYVIFKAVISVLVSIMSGVPQGGVCSALLFNIFVRNLALIIIFSKLFQYADDCALKKVIYSKSGQKELQQDLNNIQEWSLKNGLYLNAKKSVHLRFTFKKDLDINYYNINNETIPTKNSHKHLGITILLSFSEHTDNTVNSCLKKWGYLKKLCKYADSSVFLRLYKSYLLPLLEYANLCWVPNNSQCYQIESVERQVTKFICYKNGFCDISYEKRLESLNLDSIQMRRETNILIFVFKCIHNYKGVPNIWKNIFKTNDTKNG